MIWVYDKFYKLYGEHSIYREKTDITSSDNKIFFEEYLRNVDPLLVSLSFSSVVYLFFITKEYDLVKRIINRLNFLSLIWKECAGDNIPSISINLPVATGHVPIGSHWARCVPKYGYNINLGIQSSKELLPQGFNVCMSDLFATYNLFKRESDAYHTIPAEVNHTLFLRIQLKCARTVKELVEILKKIDAVFFDANFVFDALKWKCTHDELVTILEVGSRVYFNQNVFLLLCYLYRVGKLEIERSRDQSHVWNKSDTILGPAMFDYHVYHNKESILKYLSVMQYNKNRSDKKQHKEKFEKLIKQYRQYSLALNPKELKIKRGILINFISAGLGDIFCVSS